MPIAVPLPGMRVLLPFLLLPALLNAQSDIAEARTYAIGSVVTITGIVTNGPELGSIRYLQDGTAGIAVFPGSSSVPGFAPASGQEVQVTGPLKLFNGLLEIDPVMGFQVLSSNNPLPAPQLLTPNELGEDVEGMLVRVNGCQFTGGGTFPSGTSTFSSIGQNAPIYLWNGHSLVGDPVPGGLVDLIGICSQYDTGNPPVGGYQVLPRGSGDLVPSTTINLTSGVEQQAITPDGFTLSWSTNLAGSSEVAWGPTPALGSFAGSGTPAIAHSVALTGLGPAAFVHARAFSVLGSDTAWGERTLYSTASAVPGWVRVVFNREVDTSVSQGTPAVSALGSIADSIAAYIDLAQSTLDVAVYNTSNYTIVGAVNDALVRGVQVRWIAEGANANFALSALNNGVPVLYRTNSPGSGMHNKFVVIDADDPANAHVLSGSTNFTQGNLFDDPNNLVIVRDQALALAYTLEFEEMWGGSGPQPVPANSRFGEDKTDNTPHRFQVGGTLVESFFSPSDGTTHAIREHLDAAQASIELALFILTENTLRDALLEAHADGVWVRGVVDDANAPGSDFFTLTSAGIDLYDHSAFPELLHHKYAILDHSDPGGDPLVITGSHNWTFSANTVNDENTLIIHDPAVADQFFQEWTARRDAFTGVAEVGGIGPIATWPVPFHEGLQVTADDGIVEVRLLDTTGRIVLAEAGQGPTIQLRTAHLAGGGYVLEVRERSGRTLRSNVVKAP